MLELGRPPGYQSTVAAAVRIAMRDLAAVDPTAANLLRLTAFLAPEPVPATVFAATSARAPGWVRQIGTSAVTVGTAFASIARYGLATVTTSGIQMHRLTQAVLRDLPGPEPAATRADAESLIAAAAPEDTENPA